MNIKKFFEYNTYQSKYDNQFKLLRKLTLKSKLGFGKFKRETSYLYGMKLHGNLKNDEATIEEILNSDIKYKYRYFTPNGFLPLILREEHSYLRWIYFNMENITFVDDILDTLGIYEKYRIKKPGKNPNLSHKLENELDEAFLPENFEKRWQSKYFYDIEKFLNNKPESKYILPYDKK